MFEKCLSAYDALKRRFGLNASAYLPFAASVMAKLSDSSDYYPNAEKAMNIYKLIKKEHPVLTSGEDSANSVTNMVIAQQAAVMGALAASSAAASASFI